MLETLSALAASREESARNERPVCTFAHHFFWKLEKFAVMHQAWYRTSHLHLPSPPAWPRNAGMSNRFSRVAGFTLSLLFLTSTKPYRKPRP
jgi:hypothetical protein